MAGTDPVDTHGHDKDAASAQEATLDVNAAPGSDGDENEAGTGRWDPEDFKPFGSAMVLAQSSAEVEAQIANVPASELGS